MPQANRRLNFINFLKAVACMGIVSEHCLGAFFSYQKFQVRYSLPVSHSFLALLTGDYPAVYLFFLMSGFLLIYSNRYFAGGKDAYKKLGFKFVNRLLYLYIPGLFLGILAMICIRCNWIFIDAAYAHGADSYILTTIASGASFSELLRYAKGLLIGYVGVNSQLWYLHYEMVFGSLGFLLLAVTRDKRVIRILLEAVAAVAIWLVTKDFYGVALVCGFLTGDLAMLLPESLLGKHRILFTILGLVAVSCGISYYYATYLPQLTTLFLALGVILFYLGIYDSEIKTLPGKIMNEIGRCSYGIYLVHFLLIQTLGSLIFCGVSGTGWNVWVQLFLTYGLVLLLSYLCGRFMTDVFLNYQGKLIRKALHFNGK